MGLIVVIGRYGIEQDSAMGPRGDFGRGIESFGPGGGGGVGASTEDGKGWRDLAGPGDGGDLVPGDLASLKPTSRGTEVSDAALRDPSSRDLGGGAHYYFNLICVLGAFVEGHGMLFGNSAGVEIVKWLIVL